MPRIKLLRSELDLFDFVAITAILLRLFGVIGWPWYVVLSPIWVPILFVIARSAIIRIHNHFVRYGELEDEDGCNYYHPDEFGGDDEHGGRA